MRTRNGKSGRPRDVRTDPDFAPLVAEIDQADAVVLTAIRDHAIAPSQAATVRLLEAQMRVASLRAHLARRCGDDAVAHKETDAVVRLAKSRDDAAKLLWGDELRELHERISRTGGVASAIAAELAEELEAEDPRP